MNKASIKDILKGINKGVIKGANIQGFSFRAEQGMQKMYACLHTEIYGIDFESEEEYDLKVVNFKRDINLDNYRYVSLDMFPHMGHYKSILDIMVKTKKGISFEVILFNSCDLYDSLNLESHELYLILTDSKGNKQRYLIDKFVGRAGGSDLIRIY